MTRNYFNEIVEGHKTANDLTKAVYYIHYREFSNCLSKIQGVEGDADWNKLIKLFEGGDVEITDMCLYAKDSVNAYSLPEMTGWNFPALQPIDFEDENYVHQSVPILNMSGEFTEVE